MASPLRVRVDFSDFFAGLKLHKKLIIRKSTLVATMTAEMIKGIARQKAPIDRGGLRASIVVRNVGTLIAQVVVTSPYANYIEYGTGIYAENGQGRRTPWIYHHYRYGFVKTRGQRPQPFMRPAETLVRSMLPAIIRKVL